jgi:diguanylate cyclase (GGDEF)-like protein/PAS domain S-box-containing protein
VALVPITGLSVWTGRLVAAVEAVLLVGWVAAPDSLAAALGGAPTKPVTCLALLLLGGVLGWPAAPTRLCAGALAVVAAIGVEGLVSALLARPLVADAAGWPATWRAVAEGSLATAAATSVALLLLVASYGLGFARRRVAAAAGFTALALSYLGALGHLYGVTELFTLQTATTMVVPTVVAMLAVSGAVLVRHPSHPLPVALALPGIAGALLRNLLFWTLLLPPAEAWVLAEAQRHDVIDPAFALALMAMVSVAGAVLLVVVSAQTALRVDRQRERVAADLERLNDELAGRVREAVTAAEEGQERLRFLLDGTPVGIFETAPDGSRRYVNRRWLELTGLESEVDGDEWVDVLHPDDRDRVRADWAAAIATGSEFSARYRYLRPDGEVTWVDATAVAVLGADGTVTRWLGSVTDVSDQVTAQRMLTSSERRYRSVVSAMAEGVLLQDPDGSVVTANESACRLLGLSLDELRTYHVAGRARRVLSDDGTVMDRSEMPFAAALSTGRAVRDRTLGVEREDGSVVWLQASAEPLTDDDDPTRVTGVVTTFADITQARAAAAALRRSEQQFRETMKHAPIGMAVVEVDGRIREVNRALCRLLGYDERQLLTRTFQEITHPEDLDADLDNLARLLDGSLDHYTMEKRYVTSSGSVVWAHLAVSLARDADGSPAWFVAQVQDVTDARAAEQQLRHRALHDPLTGLPNRDLLMDHLSHALARSSRSGTAVAVLFCDLDRFKDVNDTHGHEAGDVLLTTVADRLRRAVRPGDTVARLGGDEFVVVTEGLHDASAVIGLAKRLRTELRAPVDVGPASVVVGCSIGMAVAGAEDDARSVLREADAAMYRAKARGRDRLEAADLGDVPAGA